MAKKKASWLCEYCRGQLGRPYWMGTFGQEATAWLYNYEKNRFPRFYTATDYPSQYGQKVHDCCGIVKGALWCNGINDPTPDYNADQDCNPRMFYERSVVRGIVTKEFKPRNGLLIYDANLEHVGVCVDGAVIESRGHAYGVVKTKLPSTRWKYWSECIYFDYEDEEDDEVKFDELPYIQKGSRGTAVKVVQSVVGCYPDGIAGNLTDTCIKNFQTNHGLEVDGIVGPKTWKAILESL